MKGKEDTTTPKTHGTLFPIDLSNGARSYFYCDFSDLIGFGSSGDVYKGYRCSFINPKAKISSAAHINPCELNIDLNKPVAIKIYKTTQLPLYPQINHDSIAVVDVQGRVVQIMNYIDGFHIDPDRENNPELLKFTFLQTVDLAWQLVLGLDLLHSQKVTRQGLVHGDMNGFNIKIHKVSDTKTNVFYLDFDFVKPISSSIQIPQGTPEHSAIEILSGIYSEDTDFYALTPILYTIFGATNPLQKILQYRDTHPHVSNKNLIKKYSQIGFCSAGLFSHFDPKPEQTVLDLLSQFMQHMGNKEKQNRPKPNAILEFFTALRQWCLANASPLNVTNSKEQISYLMRLYIASDNEQWLYEKKLFSAFTQLPENSQTRLINLMSIKHKALLYKNLLEQSLCEELLENLKSDIYNGLIQLSKTVKKPSWISLLFTPQISAQDISWLAQCFTQHDFTSYFSRKNKITTEMIEQIKQPELRALVKIAHQSLILHQSISLLEMHSTSV
jgi:serine/threonine protein kinase